MALHPHYFSTRSTYSFTLYIHTHRRRRRCGTLHLFYGEKPKRVNKYLRPGNVDTRLCLAKMAKKWRNKQNISV